MLKLHRILIRECRVLPKGVLFCGVRHNSNSLCADYNAKNNTTATYPPIAEYYAGKSIFLTGGTGFLGKLLIERLLYNCKDLDKIYMLIREKAGADTNDRIKQLLQNPIFTKLKAEKPHTLKKIIPVIGDIALPELGMATEDQETLMDKVSVVFHSAATVNFKELLPETMNINYEGTKRIHNLCKRMTKMEVLVFLSTAYSQTKNKTLEEKVYPPPAEIDDVYKFIEKYGNDRKATIKFLDGRPSAYTFSKALAESYIAENHSDVPSIIVRPSTISCVNEGPLPGWLDNWFGATKYIHDVANGWIRIAVAKGDCALDLIPVDYVSNMSIVAAARFNRSNVMQVNNCCSSSENPITIRDIAKNVIGFNVAKKRNDTPFPFFITTKSETLMKILHFIFVASPAYMADFFLVSRGKKAKYVKIQKNADNIRDSLEYYATHDWVMKSDKIRNLTATLSNEDKRDFPFDPKNIRWEKYLQTYCDGIYRYLRSK